MADNTNNRKDKYTQPFWDIITHKKKKLTMDEYTALSCNLTNDQLYIFAKKAFSSLALCGFLMYLIVYLTSTLVYYSVSFFITSNDILSKLTVDISCLSFAFVAFPVLFALTTFMPKIVPKQQNFPLWQLILFAIASLGLVYVGNLMGMGAASILDLITGKQSVSPINSAVEGLSPYKVVLYFVIFPAVFEELIFRKLIIDRTAFFGETASVLFSALFFALYHMNLYQFFYAFFVGYLFGIIYIKTGKITGTITLHGFINFVGTVLPLLLRNNEKFLAVYNIVLIISGILGVVIILLGISYAKSQNGRYIKFKPEQQTDSPQPISLNGKAAVKAVILNPGMIIFIAFALLNFLNI